MNMDGLGTDDVDDELRLARVQLVRALSAEGKLPAHTADLALLADIFDEIVSRIELLELARHCLTMSSALARGAT
jgi:hypothetical protein